MVQGWATVLVLAFGIVVAVIGVIAYLRMFRKNKAQDTSPSPEDDSSPGFTYTAATREMKEEARSKSERADTRD